MYGRYIGESVAPTFSFLLDPISLGLPLDPLMFLDRLGFQVRRHGCRLLLMVLNEAAMYF
jgi:hypothetical protein